MSEKNKQKKHRGCEEDYALNPRTCACKCQKPSDIGEYLNN